MTGISMIIIWKIVSIFALNSTVDSYEKDPYLTRQQSGYPKASDLLHERYWRAKNICQPAARFFTSLRMTSGRSEWLCIFYLPALSLVTNDFMLYLSTAKFSSISVSTDLVLRFRPTTSARISPVRWSRLFCPALPSSAVCSDSIVLTSSRT